MDERADPGFAWEILQRYSDPASEQFDAVLAAAGLDVDTARALRFWQRESVASVKHFAAQAIPAALAAIAAARDDARAATDRAAAAWRTSAPATEVPADAGLVLHLPEPAPPSPSAPAPAELLEQRRRTVAARLAQLG